jgi:acyl-CoA synthetase (AMP-forming)/AMP-acid ligase II
MNIMMLLEMAASGFGDRAALGTSADHLTYQQLFEQAGRASTRLADGSVANVGFLDEASPALPITLFGSAWAGLPFAPLNYRLDDEGLAALAARLEPATIVRSDAVRPVLDGSTSSATIAPSELLDRSGDIPASEWSMDGDDIAVLLFTSGTTGEPKAAVLRHKHLVSYILASVEFMGAGEEEATLISAPPYHIAGLAAILSSVYTGRRIVQLPSFDPDAWIDLAIAEEITHAMVVPTMLARIVDRLADRGDEIPSIRALSYGGGKMPTPVIEHALSLMPSTNFVNAYGLTETSSTIALLGPDDHREAMASDNPDIRRRLGSVGKPLPATEVTIRDENGTSVAAGTEGEVWVRGEQVSGEYLGKDPRVTAEGWFPTNDGGWIDVDGYLFVTGRIDDVIIRGAENISPGEIEDVLESHDLITDSCAIGVADQQWGERIVAAVVPNHGVDADQVDVTALQDLVRERLRSSRVPERIEVFDELPYNETGKLLRREIRVRLSHLGDGSTT